MDAGIVHGRHPGLVPGEAARHLLRYALATPGCTPHEAAQGTAFPRRQLGEAMRELLVERLLLVFRKGTWQHLFPVVPGIEDCWEQVVALRNPERTRLHIRLLGLPACKKQEILELIGKEFGWPAPTTQSRLSDLVSCGLVQRQQVIGDDRRSIRLQARPPHPTAQQILAGRAAGEAPKALLHHLRK